MKNKFKNLILCLGLAIMLPVTLFLSGCGATPKNKVLGVSFDSMIYDEETGYAIFEVDQNTETPLDYKVYPSTCSGYKVYFDPVDKGTAENSARFTFQDGKVTVNSASFEEITYKVRIGSYTDTCIIRLKTYPIQIKPEQSSMVIGAYETASINVIGTFVNANGVTVTRNITEYDFNFAIEPADETIIGVDNPNRLKFRSIRNESVDTTVKVTLLNVAGVSTGLSFDINVKITQNAGSAFLMMEKGYDLFIRNDDTIEVDFNELDVDGSYRVIKFDTYILSTDNVWIEEDCGISYSVYNSLAKVSSDGQKILISDTVVNGYEITVKINTDVTRGDGSLFTIKLTMKIVIT